MVMKMQSIEELEKWLVSVRPDVKKVNWMFALEDMRRLMADLGDPQETCPVVHIAGTSGKTSTAYFVSGMLQAAGKKVGLTVSPHVDSVTERVQVNGKPLSDEKFLDYWNEFMDQKAVDAEKITYFGLLVAFAFWVFAKEKVDYAVVEVGMGGMQDATNVIRNSQKVAAITDIGLDHTQFLGETLPAIAEEKAGIIQQGNEVFALQQSDDVIRVFEKQASEVGAMLHVDEPDLQQAPEQFVDFQKRNWVLAREVVAFLSDRDGFVLNEDVYTKAAQTVVPARMEELKLAGKHVILDVSHNAQKMKALADAFEKKFPGKKATVVLAMGEGREFSIEDVLDQIKRFSDRLIVTQFSASQDVYRPAMLPDFLKERAESVGMQDVEAVDTPEEALQVALGADTEIVIVTGSFFLLNHIRPAIRRLQDD